MAGTLLDKLAPFMFFGICVIVIIIIIINFRMYVKVRYGV